jgi:hypothetical protein
MSFWVWFIIAIVVISFLAIRSNTNDKRRLIAAPSGSTKVTTVKAVLVNQEVRKFSEAGWQVVEQSSAKSFGSQAQVTITFRKP